MGTPVYTSIIMEGDKLIQGPLQPDVHNLYENFLTGLKASEDGDCLGVRKGDAYEWSSYSEVLKAGQEVGMGLRSLGLSGGEETRLGIYAKNCPEWVMSQLGAASQGMVVVPLYDTLGADAVHFVIDQAEIACVVAEGDACALKLLSDAGKVASLKTIVGLSPFGGEVKAKAAAAQIRLLTFAELRTEGRKRPLDLALPGLDDTALICYTSGTTGTPKGVLLSNRNLLANAAGNVYVADRYGIEYAKAGKVTLSYLPLAHLFEQMNQIIMFGVGGKIGFLSGDIRKLMEDAQILRPTFLPVVPRLLNRMSDAVNTRLETASPLAKLLFRLAYKAKLAEMRSGVFRRDSIWDRLVFNRIQAGLGGRVELMVTGSAPISADVLEMCRVVTGAIILEGYGQTECAAVATVTVPGEMRGGHVGGPGPAAHITLVDVPELNYFAREGAGEICIRGPCVTRGYFKAPDKTAETIDEFGWLHTGDVGRWEPSGTLRIVDRKKHIFKLAQGEYVAPEKIESVYARCVAVEQVFVDGDSLERYLVAIVVPNEAHLRHWWAEEHADEPCPDFAGLCNNGQARAHLLAEMRRVGKENGLNSIEQVQAIHLHSEPFSVANGLLTPTLKSKRPQLRTHFADVIAALYRNSKQ